MNFGKSFTYIFDDPQWFDKLLIPILVSLIPLVGSFAVLGYILRTIANVARGEAYPLPRFSFGEDLGRGFRYFLVQLVWSIPALIMSGLLMIPTTALERSNGGSAIAWIFIVLFAGGLFIYALFMMLFSPIIMANFAVKNTFGAGFEIGNFFRRLGNNFGAWLLVFAGMLIGGLIAPLGSIVILVGVLLTTTYVQLMVAHLTGQAYAVSEVRR
ncbi:MAG: DUF4013 domain-containing protein [Anaerolineaceae bacterium]|jgi:hypothetical protein